MQDQEPTKSVKGKLSRSAWGILSLLLLIGAGIYFWSLVNKAPYAEWRNAFQPLPWKHEGVVISKAEAVWKNSKGDERMELRSFCFPSARIKLDEAQGEGLISIRFFDNSGAQIGDRSNIPYKDGSFTARNTPSVQINGNEVIVRLEDGYKTRDLYTLHQVDMNEPYWRVEVECIPQGQERAHMGHISVIPHDL